MSGGERIQKIIARSGICSRRKAEELIQEGRVTLNGITVTEPGTKADLSRDVIKVDGQVVHPWKKKVYILLNKPTGVVTTRSDEKHRPTVMELLKGEETSALFPVGRLDLNSEGLLLITNDGELADRLTNPRSKVEKTYLVRVRGVPDERTIKRLSGGMLLDGVRTRRMRVELIGHGKNSWLKVIMREGKKNQLRRMFQAVGHPVVRLKRIALGGLELGDLPPGAYRRLTRGEIMQLQQEAARAAASGHEPRT